MRFTKTIVDYSKQALFGNQRCIFCKRYWNYLMSTSLKKRKALSGYLKSLRSLWKQCFQ